MYEKGVLNSREEKVFSRIPHQVLYFEVFSRISRVFFFFCQSCLRMVWSLEVYKYWIGPLGELRVARDGPGIRTSSRKLLLADRTCPYNRKRAQFLKCINLSKETYVALLKGYTTIG